MNATSHHPNPATDVNRMMRQVMFALAPGTLVYAWLFNTAIVIQIVLCCFSCVLTEALILKLRKRAALPIVKDGSAILAGWLLALAIPPIAPWWIAITGGALAMLLGKHLYGGLGFNPFNPAMVGYAFLLVSFPTEMTQWPVDNLSNALPAAGFIDSTLAIFGQGSGMSADWDALTRATPLDRLKQFNTYTDPAATGTDLPDVYGLFGLHLWEWINVAWLMGGIWLLWQRVISWQPPVFVLSGLFLSQLLIWWLHNGNALSPFASLFAGSAMLGAFFIATDPVSSATTPLGKIIFALGIGVLTSIIRQYSSYPEGIAFAVLLMNCMAPVLDHFCKRQRYR